MMIRYILEHNTTKIAFDAYSENHAIHVAFVWGDDHGLKAGDRVDVYKATGDDLNLPVDASLSEL